MKNPKKKKITVAISPALYRQSRQVAAEFDTTVTAMAFYILEQLPSHLRNSNFPVGGPVAKPVVAPPNRPENQPQP